MEGTIEYSIAGAAAANDLTLNLCKALSGVNNRGYGTTKSNGDLLTYVCDFEFINNTASTEMEIFTAKENWVTKNAFKKWHELRNFMFESSGISRQERGRYSKTLRPAFGPQGAATNVPAPVSLQWDSANEEWADLPVAPLDSGDWTYTQIVVETNPDSPDTSSETDQFYLHMCGPNLPTASGDQNWTTVGMVQSYMADRTQPSADPADPVDHRSNPLALLKGRSESVAETLGINATEAVDGPPYDVTTDANTYASLPVLAGYSNISTTGALTTMYNVRIPAGMCMIRLSGAADIRIKVKRVELAHA